MKEDEDKCWAVVKSMCLMALMHLLIFSIFTIRFVPTAAVLWPSRGKFVHGLPDILFVAYHTIATWIPYFAHAKFWLSGKYFAPVITCKTYGIMDLLCFLRQPRSAVHTRFWNTFDFLLCLSYSKVFVVSMFLPNYCSYCPIGVL